jgi:hypothetical protein
MDELQLLRDCLPEQRPPGPDVVTAARERLNGGGRGSSRVPLAGVRPARRELLIKAGLPTAGVAVAAAVTLAVTVAGPGPAAVRPQAAVAAPSLAHASGSTSSLGTGYPTGAGYIPYSGELPTATAGGGTDGRAVLLTAATQVAKETLPVTGRYWVTTAMAGNFLRIGPADDPYMVLDESQVQNWAARSPKDFSPLDAQQLGAAPVSAADRAAWQRNGSPTVWSYVGQSDGLADAAGGTDGVGAALAMAGGPLYNEDAGLGSQQFQVGARTLTLAQLQALPADPAKLRTMILSGGVAAGETPSAFLLDGVLPPLLETPVTPAVRAALYQMLAAMPGIKSLGEVTDPAGQRGDAVSYTATYRNCGPLLTPGADGNPTSGAPSPSCTTQEILIINPATGLPLAEELRYLNLAAGHPWTAPDQLFSYEIFGPSHWTNANPPTSAQSPGAPLAGSTSAPAPAGSGCAVVLEGSGTATPMPTPSAICVPASAGKTGNVGKTGKAGSAG